MGKPGAHGVYVRDLSKPTAAQQRLLEVYRDNPGKRLSEIAVMMGISPKSVSKYGQELREKFGVGSLAEAVQVWSRQ